MASGIAHDFNNHLAAIQGNHNLVKKRLEPATAAALGAGRIDDAISLALGLTERLAIYAGRCAVDHLVTPVESVLKQAMALLSEPVPDGITVRIAVEPGCPDLEADLDHLAKAVANLVANALEAMLDRNGLILLSAGALDERAPDVASPHFALPMPRCDKLYIDIADAGAGMSPERIDSMFDPFFSTKIRGEGMGLPVVLGIVRSHHGNVAVKSVPDQGTTVRLILPVTQPDD